MNVPLRCQCGAVRGELRDLEAGRISRLVCMCKDCQAFTHFLGRADDILDDAGGTDIVQVAPANYAITDGLEHVQSLRLSPNGAIRFFTGCCNTPIGNTASASMPFIGVPTVFLAPPAGESVDSLLGPPRALIWSLHARSPAPAGAHPKIPPRFLARAIRLMLMHRLRGRHRPFAFFDRASGAPISPPRILTREERRAVTPPVPAKA